MITLTLLIFLAGLILGSFYNVAGLRIPAKESIVMPRSACPSCGHTLAPLELVPVISYLVLKGNCRKCGKRISPLYPIIELMTGLLFAAAPLLLGWSMELIIAWALISLMVIIFVSDIMYMLIPNKILLFFTIVFLLLRIFIPLDPWWDPLAGGLAGFMIPFFIAVISKGGMGGGDIKLFSLVGFAIGLKGVLLSFIFATLLGAIFGVAGLIAGLVKRGEPMPFGPFIAAGTISAYFFGQDVLDWYWRFL
ncbi:prepilin peptidase [Pradoshia sp.]|uniref:prepilin peptidase n=1 Tax=Pradoshia sp. TaxID=2651281 RepID=UPI003F10BB7C